MATKKVHLKSQPEQRCGFLQPQCAKPRIARAREFFGSNFKASSHASTALSICPNEVKTAPASRIEYVQKKVPTDNS